MDKKDKIDALSKIASVVNMKMLGLMAVAGGCVAMLFNVINSDTLNIELKLCIGLPIGLIFMFASTGTAYNYDEIKRIKNEMEQLINE